MAKSPNTCTTPDWKNLSSEDIRKLNTYDFMSYIGKEIINPGGVTGREQILSRLKIKRGNHVLEIGGGNGHAACHIARTYGCKVTTIDISPRSVEEAVERAAEERLSHLVRCEAGDVSKLRFAEGTFDAVICQAVMMFVDQDQALSEVRRVLKPGGAFGGLEFSWKMTPTPEVRDATYEICGCKTLRFHDREGWVGKLRDAGFIRPSGEEYSFGLLSVRGFLRDEGIVNSLQIAGKVISCRATLMRMSEIWSHFSRNLDYFSYVVLTGEKIRDI